MLFRNDLDDPNESQVTLRFFKIREKSGNFTLSQRIFTSLKDIRLHGRGVTQGVSVCYPVLAMLSSILVPTVANPWLLFVAVPMAVAVVYISQYYLKTSWQLKRLESINRSPVFSHISDTIDGLETIRTRARQKDFEEQFYRYVVQYQPVVLYNIKV